MWFRTEYFSVNDAIVHRDPAACFTSSRLMEPQGHTPERVSAQNSFRTVCVEHPHPSIRIAAIRGQHHDQTIATNRAMSITDLSRDACVVESARLRYGPGHRIHKHIGIATTVHFNEGQNVHEKELLRRAIQLIPASQKQLHSDRKRPCMRKCISRD